MSSVPPTVKDVTDFQFKKLRALRVFDQLANRTEKSPSLLAVSNKYGLVFVGTARSIKVIRTNDIEQLDEDKSLARVDATEYPFQEVVLSADITDLALSCDSLTLAACLILDHLPYVNLYDVRAFGEKSTNILPFMSFGLSSLRGLSLMDFLWNPAMATVFAAILADGSVFVYDTANNTPKIYGSLSPDTASTAICWSPKGKQLVVGSRTGTLTQHTPDLKVAKTIPAPYIYEGEVAVINIAWLSSYQFAVVYRVEDRPCLVLVNAPKSGKPTYTDFDDICFGASEQRPLRYYMLHVPEMRLLICSSSNAMDVGILSNKEGDGTVWQQWNLEDSGRAELPLLGNDETYPLGMALNVTAQHHILINDTDSVPPKPLLHMLSTGGVLLSYRMFGDEPSTQSFMKPPEALNTAGIRRPPATSTFGTATNAAAAKENLLPKFNEMGHQSPATAFGKPTGVSITAPVATMGSSFVASPITTQTSFVTPTTTGRSFFGTSAITTQTSFGTPTTTPGASFATAATTTGTPFTTPTTTLGQSSAFGNFGSIAAGKPVTSGSIITGKPLFGTTFDKPAQMTPVQPTPVGITNSVFVPSSTFVTTSSASNKTGVVTFASNLTGKRTQGDSGMKSYPVTGPTLKADKETVTKPKPTKRGQVQTALVSALNEELSKFSTEVQQAKKRTSLMVENVASEEVDSLRTEIGQLNQFLQEVEATTRSMNAEIHVLRNGFLDSFNALEVARSLDSRSKDKRFVHLLKTRSLDPMSSKKMKAIRSSFFYLDTQLQEANMALDKQWDEFQRVEKKSLAGGADLSSLELICRAMTVNHEITFSLRQSVDLLADKVSRIKSGGHQTFRLFPPALDKATDNLSSAMQNLESSFSQRKNVTGKMVTGSSTSDPCSLSNIMLNDSIDCSPSPFSTPKVMSKVKRMQLRSFLEARPVNHVRPATPVEEFSQLISPNFNVREFLEDRESEECEEREAQFMLPILPKAFTREKSSEREGSGDSSRPIVDTKLATATPPIFKPFFNSQSGGAFAASRSVVSIQPGSAAPPFPESRSAGATTIPTFVSPFSGDTTNIFTLAASAPKGVKGSEPPMGLKIGGIPLENIVREAPPELSIPKSIPNQPKSPILTSLLDSKSQSSSPGTAANAVTGFGFGLTCTKLPERGQTSVSVTATSTLTSSLNKPTGSAFSFSSVTTSRPPFGSLPPFEFSQNKNLFASAGGFKESTNKPPKLSTAYEDVTPPTTPHVYAVEEGYLVEEPSNDEEEEYEGEEDELEDEEGERGEDYEDQEAWEDEEVETIDANEYAQVKNAELLEKEAGEDAASVPPNTDKAAEGQGKTDLDDGARNETSSLPKAALDMSGLAPIFKSTGFKTSGTTSAMSAQDAAAPSTFAAPIDAMSDPAVAASKLSSPATGNNGAAASEGTAIAFKPSLITSTASVFTPAAGSDVKSLSAAVSPTTAATTAFRFALPAGTSATAVTTATKTPSSAFSFTMPPASTPVSTFAASASPQSLFGSKLSFGPSEGSAGTVHDQNTATPSIFGGGKPAAPFGTQQGSPGAFSLSQPGTSAFGNTTTATSSAFGQASTTFGQAPTSVFGQSPSNASTAFGQQSPVPAPAATSNTGGTSVFGQGSGSLFGGLGAKPNPENVNKNIFGSPSNFGTNTQSHGLFGSSASTDSGWNKPADGGAAGGGFAGTGFSAAAGSVSQSGFGFQQPSAKPGSFGGSAGFGSPPTFGGAPTFGAVNQMGNRLFGASATQPTGFGSFAAAASDAPTFGSLASQPSAMTFNSIAAQQPVSVFGSPTQTTPAFGAAPSFTSPAFGAPAQMNASPFGAPATPTQPTAFGSPSSFGSNPPPEFGSQPTQGSPSFSQWR